MGSKGGGGSQTTTQNPWSGIQPFLTGGNQPGQSGIYPQAGHLFEQNRDIYAGVTGNERQGRSMQAQYANQLPGLINPLQGASQQALNAPDIANNPYIEDYMDAATRPFEQQYALSMRPSIGRNYVGTGDGSTSTREGVEAGVARGLTNQAMMDTRAKIGNAAYGQGLEQQRAAMALYPQMLQMGMMPGQIMQGIGQQQRADRQQQLNEPYERLQRYASLIQPGAGIGGTISTPMQSGGGGIGGGIAGGLGGLGAAGMLGLTGPLGWGLGALGALGGAFG